MNKRLLYLVFTLILSNVCLSQDLPNITPPSPTAYELGKYGQLPIGMFTGTPNVDIPLYTYKSGNLSIPISLSYGSNGIKVDQLSTNVGLGWNLNIGGVITRIVRDESDEENEYIYPESDLHEAGYNSPVALDYFYLGGQNNVDTETDMFMYNFLGFTGGFILDSDKSIILIPNKDLTISGYSENGQIGFEITDSKGIKYIFLEDEVNNNVLIGGAHPEPDYKTTAWYLTKIIHPMGDEIYLSYLSQGYHYIMSKSETIQVATPTYQTGCEGQLVTGTGYTIGAEISNRLNVGGKKLVEIHSNNPKSGYILIDSNTPHPEIYEYKMVTDILIKDANDTIVERFDFNYHATVNERMFLNDVQLKDPNKKYSFEYIDPEGLASRLSKAQDFWGYFNGKTSNLYYFPNPQSIQFTPIEFSTINIGAKKEPDSIYTKKGMLKKIYYPTKGFTEFSYEPNTYLEEETSYPPKTHLNLVADTGELEAGSSFDDVGWIPTISFDQTASLSAFASFNSQECSNDILKSKALITVKDDQTGNNIDILQLQQYGGYVSIGNSLLIAYNSPNNQYYVNLEAGHSYTVTLHPTFDCVKSNLDLQYYNTPPTNQMTNLISGGLRVKDVKDYTSDGNLSKKTRYYYGRKESLNESTGEKGQTANYFSKSTNRISCGACGYVDLSYTTLNSSSLRPLFNASSNSSTYYKYVTLSYGGDNFENGGEENEFIIQNDYPGNPIYGDPIESSTWVNLGWSNGLLKKNTIFKKGQANNYLLVKQTINNYLQDPRYFKKEYGYTINKKFDLICTGDITYSCTEQDTSKQYTFTYCAANHTHHWLIGGVPIIGGGETICIADGADMQTGHIPNPCYGKNVGYIVTHPNYLENLDIMEYSTNSYWYYLNQTIEKQYDVNGLNPVETITDYFYDNPEHLQLTRTKTSTSEDKPIIKKNYYPDDVLTTTSLGKDSLTKPEFDAIDLLKNIKSNGSLGQHRISEQIQIDSYKDINNDGIGNPNELTSVQRTNYKNWGSDLVLPELVQSLKGVYNSQTNKLQARIVYEDYYDNGNVKEVSKADGAHIIYIWGYNEQYPIVKVENATFVGLPSNVQTVIDTAITASNNDIDIASENDLRTALSNVRYQFPNSMVTTYTYDPLIGMTSMTDPKGNTVYYEYDAYNRLEYVKDSNLKILSQNKYHYKN